MKSILIILCLVIVVSCGGHLHIDPSIPAIKAGYPTLEFQACGKHWHGLGVCSLDSAQDYNQIDFKIQGYYDGTGIVVSENCAINQNFSYVDNQLINIQIPGKAVKNCLLSVTLSPKYPNEENSGLVIHSLQGHLSIKVKNAESWVGLTQKVTGDWHKTIKLKVGGQGNARVVIRGCGIAYEKEAPVDAGVLEFELSEAVIRAPKGLCILEGIVIDPQFEDFLFTIVVAQYATELPTDPDWRNFRFSKLAFPSVKDLGEKIEITAPDSVSIISLDGIYVVDTKKKFKFSKDRPHIIRTITVAGRSVLGFWDQTKQQFEWVQ